MKKNRKSNITNNKWINGFTLIELLIVIAIIGVLSALLMANFIGVRQRARDAQRKSNLRQIQSALELYRSDKDSYPLSSGAGAYPTTCNIPTPLTAVINANTVTYMSNIPCDPSGTSYSYNSGKYYYYSLDGSSYTLTACLENTGDVSAEIQSNFSGGSGSCTGNQYYVLTNP